MAAILAAAEPLREKLSCRPTERLYTSLGQGGSTTATPCPGLACLGRVLLKGGAPITAGNLATCKAQGLLVSPAGKTLQHQRNIFNKENI